VDLVVSYILAMYKARIAKPSAKSTNKKMGSECENAPTPEKTGPEAGFQNAMRNR
jgi:hypothetical protein